MFNKNFLMKSLGLFVIGALLGILFPFLFSSKKLVQSSCNYLLGKPLVSVGGKVWRSGDLPYDLLMNYYDLENDIYLSEKSFAEFLGVRILLAKELGKKVTNQEIPKLKDVLQVPSATAEDAREFYNKIAKRSNRPVFGGQSFEKLMPQIIAQLNEDKMEEFSNKKFQELMASGKIQMLVDPPLGRPTRIDFSMFPKRGKSDSAVTFVSVIDYMDPISRDAEPELERFYKNYSSKINFVHIPYSLLQNGLGEAFAKGAYCAMEQGNDLFWSYHKKTLKKSLPAAEENREIKDTQKLNNEVIKVAQATNLDINKFTSCLNAKNANITMKKVQNQLYSSSGFKETPSFYLNRRQVRISLKELSSKLESELN
jgi:protein-disulfide isomerase